jgi:acyl carrier protein
MDEVKAEIREYILTKFLPGEQPASLNNSTLLRASGILDSMATLRLIGFIEERYRIEVEAYEASGENFDTIDSIASLIESKRVSAR